MQNSFILYVNNILEKFHSDLCKLHSTESSLLGVLNNKLILDGDAGEWSVFSSFGSQGSL